MGLGGLGKVSNENEKMDFDFIFVLIFNQ